MHWILGAENDRNELSDNGLLLQVWVALLLEVALPGKQASWGVQEVSHMLAALRCLALLLSVHAAHHVSASLQDF